MPRDSSGNYTLPAGNPVVAGTAITPTWGNNTLNDVKTVLTASLDRSGNGGMLAGLPAFAGTKALPGYAFSGALSSGWYLAGTNDIRFSLADTDELKFTVGTTTFSTIVNVGVDDAGYDVQFFGATAGKSLLWDESADSLIVTGTTTLIGTVNLDAVDIDGAVQLDGTLTVGVNDTGYDVKFFGATAGKSMLWDESADTLNVTGTVEFDALKGTGAITITNILDEDNMSSDSATALATQQSIKAYVDSSVGAADSWAESLAVAVTSGANSPSVASGQALLTNTINETTAASGVTIDSVLLKDNTALAGTLLLGAGSVTDSSGAITFGDENLSTTGTLAAGATTVTGTVNSTGEIRIANPSATSQLYLYGASGQKANIILNEYGVSAWHVGAGTFTSGNFSISDGSTERLVIDSSGNVGIGADPLAAKVDITRESDYTSHTGHGLAIHSSGNTAYTSLYVGTDDTIDSAYIQSAGRNTSFTSKSLLLNPNGGHVGIGTTSPSQALDVVGSGKFQPAVGGGDALVTVMQTNANAYVHAGIKINAGAANPFYIYQSGSSNTLRFNYNSLSDAGGQMVITDSGNVAIDSSTTSGQGLNVAAPTNASVFKVANSHASSPNGINISYTAAAPNGAANYFIYSEDTAGLKFGVRSNGGISNFSANDVNLSDERAKKNIAIRTESEWECVSSWEIVDYNYKDEATDAPLKIGVIAQQVQEHCPELVTVFQEQSDAIAEELDEEGNVVTEAQSAREERLGVNEAQMMWKVTKTLQEAMKRIETLEAKLAAK